MASVLVTGVTGFIGAHLTVQLLNQGYRVVGSMRDLGREADIRAVLAAHAPTDRLTCVQADLLDADSWQLAAAGVDYIAHVASPISSTLPERERDLLALARQGTLNVLRAAKDQKVSRVVMTSSVAAIAYGRPPNAERPYTEEDWTDPSDLENTTPYIRSKTRAERAAWEFADEHALDLATVNPGVVLGPVLEEDYGVSAEIVCQLLDGKVPAVPRINVQLVDVRDVAKLHILALESPRAAGHRFIAAEDNLFLLEIADFLRERYPDFRGRLPRYQVPDFVMRFLAFFSAEARSARHELGVVRRLDTGKARRLLGWQTRSAQEAIAATADTLLREQVVTP